jgi:hypothetical protein
MKIVGWFFLILTIASCEKSEIQLLYGDIKGTVVNAQTGAPLAGVTVYVVGAQTATTTTTDGTGTYSITRSVAGAQVVRAELANYNTNEISVTVPSNSTLENANLALLSLVFAAGKIAIITTWDTEPQDVDSHLWVPNGTPFHLFYSDRGDDDGTLDTDPFAGLDADDTDGFGPETVSIGKTGANPHYNGNYRFFLHNYSQTDNFIGSGATVRVYDSGTLIKTYTIPATGTGIYWHVFDLNGTTFTDVNVIQATEPTAPP